MPDHPEPVLGQRFVDAVAYAVELHAEQARKGTTFPYLTHLFAVCSLVLEDGDRGRGDRRPPPRRAGGPGR